MRRRTAGFTLLELLVVVAILGIAAAAVSLSVGSREGRLADEEMARLSALFRLAQNEAHVSGRTLVWEADLTGYRFRALDGEELQDSADGTLRARAWPFEVTRIDAAPIVFGREPLLVPAKLRIATAERELALTLDAFGNLVPVE
ncbi:MAG: prepilin-type N-terminal cleavage/methylation domain-containing protein [Betaproteobacteria bacterium]|nr:prepilin-type N-terminal cleavage/methylation domain-containing protein [Betaproteobacteria bacterium]